MENIWLAGMLVVLILLLFLFSGQWVGVALATVGIVILTFMVGGGQVAMVGRLQFNILNSFVLTAVPLFIFMGFIFIHSGIADLIYKTVSPLVNFLPGGLLHTNVVAGSVFGACCGTSVAGTAAVASVACPQMQKRKYDKKLAYGSIAAAGTMSALIPPSLSFIIYGVFVRESVGALFMAGVIPGVIMTLLFMLYIGVRSVLNPEVAPKVERISSREQLLGLRNTLPIFITVFIVLGSIYLGVATPTEAAAMGGLAALGISAAYRRLNWQVLKRATMETVRVTSMVLILVVGAQVLSMGVSMLRIPTMLSAWLVSLPVHRLIILTLVMVFYIVLGMFMEGVAIMLLSLPITYPIVTSLGFGSVWFGVLVTMFIQIGLLTPPVGMDVFITHKISGEEDMTPAIKGALPFAGIMLVTAVLIIAFPKLATWLPSTMLGGVH